KTIIGLIAVLCTLPPAGAQNHFPYWHQRVTLFDTFEGTHRRDVVLLGDSITNGCEWFELFGSRRVKNRGINADTSVGVYDRLESTLAGSPAKVFLMIGTNDLANGASVDSVARMMERILDRAAELSPRTQFYVESVLPVNDAWNIFAAHMDEGPRIIELNARYRQICARKGVTYIDLYSHFKNPGDEKMNPAYTNDGLHLMAAGYQLWGRLIAPYIKRK
ncbi:MAG: sialate O-acetylesterase, partial [Bacteroidales bacterium]|nr:sialate O-acetylesterase [Bacteroidales bacterium]